ncbi:uncharacterized protein C8Q71DRAFT_400112 [Rhodofomes roseus]|uniref:Uncharacterized protein n=1 Tax=Rhodofomes roseus TaxID=34475 RepID=A0ABQ8JZ03_9APHY|nr:uncharacterized protein C8Q71DRAFT_400112 [Rhodofomes roseus]KAH9829538.1 hypothetical protein C8Q71DRAFT_400112 [Rhodofomes roseus]
MRNVFPTDCSESAYNDYGRLHFNKTTSIWSPTADRCLYFFPHQRYDATSQTFSDALCGSMARGEIRECFLGRDEGTWSYCGTFECTGVSYMYYGDFIAFQRDRPGLVERIMSKTLLNCPAEVGEHHRERILRDDELVVGCCGLVKTGHDVDIERALGAHSQASSPHALKRTSSESQSGSRKMQRQSTTSSDGRA